MVTVIQLQDRAIATLRKVLPQGRKGFLALCGTQNRFNEGMLALGYLWTDQARVTAWRDCVDMARLENAATKH